MNDSKVRLVLGVILLLLLTTTPAFASSTQQDTTFKEIKGAPLRIEVGSNGSVQVYHQNHDVGAAYGRADSGLFLAIGSDVYGPDLANNGQSAFVSPVNTLTLVSQQDPIGSGSAGDPFRIVTNQTLNNNGNNLGVVQTVSYINGNAYFRQDWAITNNSAGEVCFKAYHAADIYFAGSDSGSGYYNAASGSVGGYNDAQDWFMVFTPVTTGSRYEEGSYDALWDSIRSATDLTNSIDSNPVDNGIALQWNQCVQPGGTTTISDLWSFGENEETVIPPTPEPTVEPSPTPAAEVSIPCASCGDVHILTPDGLRYDFQETGDYILSQADSGNLMLQARQTTPTDNPNVSVNTAAALLVAGDKLEFYGKPERAFYVNDVLTEFPTSELTLPQGGSVTLTYGPSAQDYTILWPDGNTGARVIVLSNGHLDIGIARLGGTQTYEGVLGDLDGNRSNDMQVRNGDLLAVPASLDQLKTFGDSWRVSEGASLFSEPLPADETEAPKETLTLLDLDPADRAEAAQTCAGAGVSSQVALENCTYDVAATGDTAFVESALTFEEAVAQQPEPISYEPAVPAQTLMVGQQYAVPDVPGTFRYFQLTALPEQAGDPATLALCPDLQTIGTVYIEDIITDEAAPAQGLTATNEPCTAPVDESGAELATSVEPAEESTATAAPAEENTATAESVEEGTSTDAPVEENTATAQPAEEPTKAVENTQGGAGGAGTGLCNFGLIMPMFLMGLVFVTTNQRRRL